VFGPGLCSGPAICIAACSRRYRWCDVRACCYVSIVSTSPLFTSISEFLSLHFELNQANKPFSHFFSFQMLCYLCSLFVLAAFIVTAVIVTRSLVTRFFKLISSQTNELYQLASVAFCLLVAWISDKLGLSLELGAFVAGVMISTTEFAEHTLEQVCAFI
jgi:Kef-type K+ transport system membrane component KefB